MRLASGAAGPSFALAVSGSFESPFCVPATAAGRFSLSISCCVGESDPAADPAPSFVPVGAVLFVAAPIGAVAAKSRSAEMRSEARGAVFCNAASGWMLHVPMCPATETGACSDGKLPSVWCGAVSGLVSPAAGSALQFAEASEAAVATAV